MNRVFFKIFFVLCLQNCFVTLAFAQTPCFNADVVRGCAPLTVQITDCSGTPNTNLIFYRFEPSLTPTNTTNTHTYNTPGKYSVTQILQLGSNSDSLRKTNYIEVLDTPTPQFEVNLCANRTVSLNITDSNYEEYIINWGDGSTLQTVSKGSVPTLHTYLSTSTVSVTLQGRYVPGGCGGSNSILISPIVNIPKPTFSSITTRIRNTTTGALDLKFEASSNFDYEIYQNGNASPIANVEGIEGIITQSLENINTQNQTYCFRVRAKDACGNFNDSDSFYCNLNLNVSTQNNQNLITWSSYTGAGLPANLFQQYVLYRNNQPLQVFSNIAANQFLDQEVKCNENYCYEIRAEFSSPAINFISASNNVCVTAFSNSIPPIVSPLNSTVESPRSIRVFWDVSNEPRIIEYKITRLTTEFTNNSNDVQEIIDTDLKIDKQFCYEIQYKNECGNVSPISQKTCPVFLKASAIEAGKISLDWAAYRNASNFFERYIIEKLDENGEVYDEISISSLITEYIDTEAKTDRQILRYRIKTVIDNANEVFSYSNIVEIKQKFRIFFPNAFTPDGNERNDSFKPTYLFVKNYKMTIYNRLGEVMYISEKIEDGWNGDFKGKPAPQDAYIYVVELEDFIGEQFKTKGTFTLLRR